MRLFDQKRACIFLGVMIVATAFMVCGQASAQRDVNWQINPHGFPSNVSVFVDVQDRAGGTVTFNRNLPETVFTPSMDEFSAEQGGWLINQGQTSPAYTGSQILIMIDRSRSYTGEFSEAKRVAKSIINHARMNPNLDAIAIASFPAPGGFSESKLELSFTSNKATISRAIDNVSLPPKDDKTGGRFCNALSEGLTYFPQNVLDKYRTIIFLTGGADKGEGKGSCVQDSYKTGLVPFNNIVFKLDRRYDDKRNAHKIENGLHDLARNTSGQSLFRKSKSEIATFVELFWRRIRSQYNLRYNFPCYKQAPQIQHITMMKVEGRDTSGIKFEASSVPAPVPQITAIYPSQADRKSIDDGKVELTVDGQGFCGPPVKIRATVNGRQVAVNSSNPFRIVAKLNSTVEAGTVKITNYFGQSGESPMRFEVIKPLKGAEASSTLMFLVIGMVGLVVIAVVVVALRSRKAKVPAGAPPQASNVQPSVSNLAPPPSSATVAIGVSNAWVILGDGSRKDLKPGSNLIGREPHCQIQLGVEGVSREHSRVTVDPAGPMVYVEDLGSTNGTSYGPAGSEESLAIKLQQKQQVNTGDHIWIGGEKLTIFFSKEG